MSTFVSREKRPGEFCSVNLMTSDPEQSQEFFNKLVGWSYTTMENERGFTIQSNQTDIGAVFDVNHLKAPPNTPPHFSVVVQVENVDEMVKEVKTLGGSAHEPMDFEDRGRLAICHDPNGAKFLIWQPKTHSSKTSDGHKHGAIHWFETLTTDIKIAGEFYSNLFGWTAKTYEGPQQYTSFTLGEIPLAGMMAIDQIGNSELKPHWNIYITVDDVDQSVKLAESLGGKICVPPKDIPNVGKFAGIISPQGVQFYVMTWSPDMKA